LFSGAAYQVLGPTIFLTPNEGPPGSRVPLAGCSWFPDEGIEFAFMNDGIVFDTAGVSQGGCITTNGPTEPTLVIPISATLGPKIISARGILSGLRVNTLFDVVERTLDFEPPNGMAGDPIAASGCGWVGNDAVTIEWGYPDPNGLPIRWLAAVDRDTGCFGLEGDVIIDVPANTITGPVIETATGDNQGETTATFIVNHGGYIDIPAPNGLAGDPMTVDIFDAITGETIFFFWDDGIPFDGVGAAVIDFSHVITLPIYASAGSHTIVVTGTKGFSRRYYRGRWNELVGW